MLVLCLAAGFGFGLLFGGVCVLCAWVIICLCFVGMLALVADVWVGCLLFWFVIAVGFGYWLLDVAFGIWCWFDLFRWFGWYVAVLLCLFAGCCFGCCVVLLWLFLGLRRTVCLRVCGFWCFVLYLL